MTTCEATARGRRLVALACAVAVLSPVASRAGDPGAESDQTCVDVRIGSDASYGCLNASLGRLARQAHGASAAPTPGGTLDGTLGGTPGATSPAPAVGTFNRAATAERMGNTFGHSAVSQRPPPPVYVQTLRPPSAAR